MTSLFKFNNENKKCLNCQSDKCIKNNNKGIILYKCLNCGHIEIIEIVDNKKDGI